jgi:predicted DsbA family dithiol-disulfide isomerase
MARKIGINGVPTFLIGGKTLVNGAQDAEHLVRIIDRIAAGDESAVATG